MLSTHGHREGNNVLHEAVLKEAKHSINIILRLIEKSGEQEVGMKWKKYTSYSTIDASCDTKKK